VGYLNILGKLEAGEFREERFRGTALSSSEFSAS
jgi:hypothetical protein